MNAFSPRKAETQINELEDSFQDLDMNAVNTRSTRRSCDRSFNRSSDRSSSRNTSYNSSNNSRSGFRNGSGNYSGSNRYDQRNQWYSKDNMNNGYQSNNRYN